MRFDFTNHYAFRGFDKYTATPYKLQQHAQQAVPSSHDFTNVQSVAHAPALQRVAANPSAISAKNIVRGQYNPHAPRILSFFRAL